MKKTILSLIILLISNFTILAQSINEIDYVLDGQSAKAYSFSISRCNMDAINNTWSDWVKTKGGKISLISSVKSKKEVKNVNFKGVDEPYTIFMEVVQTTDSLQILNAFKDPHGMFLHSQSSSYATILESIKDLSFETRKSCVRLEIEQANDYLVKLNKENVSLYKRKGTLEQNTLKAQNQVSQLETKKNKLSEEISSLNNLIQKSVDSSTAEKLEKKLTTVENNYYKTTQQMEAKTLEASENNLLAQQALETITGNEAKIEDQKKLIELLKENLSKIYR